MIEVNSDFCRKTIIRTAFGNLDTAENDKKYRIISL